MDNYKRNISWTERGKTEKEILSQESISALRKMSTVSILRDTSMGFISCSQADCKNEAKYCLFVGQNIGLESIFTSSCENHLANQTEVALNHSEAQFEKHKKIAEEMKLLEAIKLLEL